MSILNVNKLGPVGGSSTITVAAGVASYTGKINCPEFDNNPSFTGNVTIGGNLGVAGTITYEDVARVDATGISTFREGYQVGPLTGIALTAYKDGSIRTTGIITASSFVGDVTGEVNASKFDTNPSGVVVTGVATATAFVPSAGQLSHRNLIINGAMTVAQYGTSSTSNGYQTVDRITMYHGGTDEAPTYSQSDVASGTDPYNLGFRKCFKVTNGNQTGGAGAGDEVQLDYKIEAQDIANSGWNYTSASSYITLSFWAKSSVAQEFKGHIISKDGTSQNYPFSLGSLSANTWTKIIKTIPGNSNLQFDTDNGEGLKLNIFNQMGTNFTGNVTENTWAPFSASTRTRDQTLTWWTTNDATFEITGFQLEVGSVATPFEHRSYADELQRCQRYYYQVGGQTNDGVSNQSYGVILPMAMVASSTRAKGILHHPVPMRSNPTVSGGGSGTARIQMGDTSLNTTLVYQGIWTTSNSSRYTWVDLSPNSGTIGNTNETGIVYANNSTYHLKVTAEL